MTSDYSPWDQAALGFDVNSSLMAIPNLMQDTSFGMGAPMSPMHSVSPTPASPFRMSPQQDMYQSPMPTHAPIPSIPVSPPPQLPPPSSAPPPMTSLPSRSSDGPQIRLNPLVMKPNLSRSLPVTTPFKKWVFVEVIHSIIGVVIDFSLLAPHITKPISRIPTLNPSIGNRMNEDKIFGLSYMTKAMDLVSFLIPSS